MVVVRVMLELVAVVLRIQIDQIGSERVDLIHIFA